MKKKHQHLTSIQQNLSPTERLNQVVEHGMCIGCGICQSLAGPEKIHMRLVQNGTERPVVQGEIDHPLIDQILSVCPGTRVHGLPREMETEASHYDTVWGIWRRLAMAWSAEPEVRHLGSTGGVMTALALYLLERNVVDFIVHAHEPKSRPSFGERWISRNRADVLHASGSRYGPTATLIDIVQILDQCETSGERFAFMGTPCDVTALRNLAVIDPRVGKYCHSMLAMVCGGFMAPRAMNRFLDGLGVQPDQLFALRYRGNGCPGPTRIETTDGRVIEKNYVDFWGEDDSAWELPFRCKICPDGIGDAADIAASDTWVGGGPSREGQEQDPGSNAVIARSEIGEQLLEAAEAAGYLAIGESLTPRDMDRFQPHQVTKKRSVWARFVGMRNAGRVVPDVSGLRLKPLARQNSLADNLSQARGTRRRCKDGSNDEPTPVPVD